MSNTSRHSSTKTSNPPFVPSPRWLSESPANRGFAGTSISDHSPAHSQRPAKSYDPNLRSPIPPPPANLYPGSPTAFNVDPGIPFLATVGPTEDRSSDGDGSVKDEESPQRRFGGGLITGIRQAVRRSLRDRTRSQHPPNPPIYTQPPELRDSGYADSSPHPTFPHPIPAPSPLHMPEFPHASSPPSSRRTIHSARPPSETLLGHADDDRDEATVIGHQSSVLMGKQKRKQSYNEYRPRRQHTVLNNVVSAIPTHDERQRPRMYPEIMVPAIMASPVSADLEFDPNYLQMGIVTPPPSETSLNTYINRFQKFVRDVNDLPWVGKERITKDYYPERSRRSDEPKHHPAIVWRSEGFTKFSYPATDPEIFSDYNDSSPSTPDLGPGLRAPRRGTYTAMDLGAEFEGNGTPLPTNPPHMTPRNVRQHTMPPEIPAPPDSMLLQGGPPPKIPAAPVLPSAVHVTYDVFPPNPPPNGPWTEIRVPQFYVPPRDATQTQPPTMAAPPSVVPIWTNIPILPPLPTPSQINRPTSDSTRPVDGPLHTERRPSVATPSQPNGDANPVWDSSQPANGRARPVGGDERHPSVPPMSPTSQTSNAPTNTRPVGDPSHHERPPSFRDHRHEWEAYPLERTGYVPYQYSEHYYGDQYGSGIHAARPPLAPPSTSSPSSKSASVRSPASK